ncbi:hypothetical protein PR048_000021 [Dryococelus australis]|uniref:Uncharacterized protein n=1 Tax=Dryococelus australis TaxID=614101 RepID=A0ABQ9IEP0_9NEOP|nr:hypothetical protein PR048_000021 [Dryococelus australis]
MDELQGSEPGPSPGGAPCSAVANQDAAEVCASHQVLATCDSRRQPATEKKKKCLFTRRIKTSVCLRFENDDLISTDIVVLSFIGGCSISSLAVAPVLHWLLLQFFIDCCSSPSLAVAPVLHWLLLQSLIGCCSSSSLAVAPVLHWLLLQSFINCCSSPSLAVAPVFHWLLLQSFIGCCSSPLAVAPVFHWLLLQSFIGCCSSFSLAVAPVLHWLLLQFFIGCCSSPSLTTTVNAPVLYWLLLQFFIGCCSSSSLFVAPVFNWLLLQFFIDCCSSPSLTVAPVLYWLLLQSFIGCCSSPSLAVAPVLHWLSSLTVAPVLHWLFIQSFIGCCSSPSLAVAPVLHWLLLQFFIGCCSSPSLAVAPVFHWLLLQSFIGCCSSLTSDQVGRVLVLVFPYRFVIGRNSSKAGLTNCDPIEAETAWYTNWRHFRGSSHDHSVKLTKCLREVNMEQCRNARTGKTGEPRENPPTSGIVRNEIHLQKSGMPDRGLNPVRLGKAEKHYPSPPLPLSITQLTGIWPRQGRESLPLPSNHISITSTDCISGRGKVENHYPSPPQPHLHHSTDCSSGRGKEEKHYPPPLNHISITLLTAIWPRQGRETLPLPSSSTSPSPN